MFLFVTEFSTYFLYYEYSSSPREKSTASGVRSGATRLVTVQDCVQCTTVVAERLLRCVISSLCLEKFSFYEYSRLLITVSPPHFEKKILELIIRSKTLFLYLFCYKIYTFSRIRIGTVTGSILISRTVSGAGCCVQTRSSAASTARCRGLESGDPTMSWYR
mgnify:CR=1 FL=1